MLGAVSLLLSGLLLARFLARFLPPERAGLLLWLFFLLPAVQIYYVSSLDALIAGCFLGCLCTFEPRRCVAAPAARPRLPPPRGLPDLRLRLPAAGARLDRAAYRRSLLRSIAIGVAALLALAALRPLLGLDYFRAFFTATRLDNPDGWPPLADPLSYIATRFENVAEILLFLGPFAIALAWQGWRRGQGEWREWTRGALLSLGALFLAGAFKTGETARACLFVLPALLLPLAAAPALAEPRAVRLLTLLLAAQALGMQALGNYFW